MIGAPNLDPKQNGQSFVRHAGGEEAVRRLNFCGRDRTCVVVGTGP
jgi:hypothetical protein